MTGIEKPATDEAITEYERQCRERYGYELARASLYLSEHPNDPEAHERYFNAIQEALR